MTYSHKERIMAHSKKKHVGLLIAIFAAASTMSFRGCRSTSPPNNTIRAENTIKCSTRAPSLPVRETINTTLQEKKEEVPRNREPGSVTIPVHFHIITTTTGEGNVSDEDVNKQIAALNAAFSGTGPGGTSPGSIGADTPFRFSLAGIDRTANDAWFNMPFGEVPSAEETEAMETLKKGDKSVLNIYTALPAEGPLGWTRIPWDPAPGVDPVHALDGVVVRYSTLPGGLTIAFNEGDTATHEVGHWFGLLHTYAGGCVDPGDEVDDTPFQAGPASAVGCPFSDSCPGQLGGDPVENFMNTTSDGCMFQFTTGQAKRMDDFHLAFRT
jgi:hypothetical protein